MAHKMVTTYQISPFCQVQILKNDSSEGFLISLNDPEAHLSTVPSQFYSLDLSSPEAVKEIAFITVPLPPYTPEPPPKKGPIF